MKTIAKVLIACLLLASLAACAAKPADEPVDESSIDAAEAEEQEPPAPQDNRDAATALIREMMALDYADMTVAAFDQTIQDISAERGTTIFAVMADSFDDEGYLDADIDAFSRSTLTYSSQDIFGEPVFMGHVIYIATDDLTAAELRNRRLQMDDKAYEAFFDEILGDITTFAMVSYHLGYDIPDHQALTVAERDARFAAVRGGLEDHVIALDADAFNDADIKDALTAKLTALCEAQSDDAMRFTFTLLEIEGGGGMS